MSRAGRKGTVTPGFLDPGHWSACFGLSYTDLILRDTMTSQRIVREGGGHLRVLCQSGGIPAARNDVVKRFLDATNSEYLWFIDTDMGFEANTVDRLVATAETTDARVVGGLAFALQRRAPVKGSMYGEKFGIKPTLYSYHEIDGEQGFRPIPNYERDSLVQVDATGAACLLIGRDVLEEVRRKYGDTWFDPVTLPHGNKGEPRTFSEDLSFCFRLMACDIPVFVNTSIKTTHEKGGLFLDEPTYDRFGGKNQ